jgi:hypothetical protein
MSLWEKIIPRLNIIRNVFNEQYTESIVAIGFFDLFFEISAFFEIVVIKNNIGGGKSPEYFG